MNNDKFLKKQKISEESPGAILKDFATLLDFIGSDGVETSGKYHLLPMKRLAELNSRLSHPIEIDLKRPLQKSYPAISGLYLLMRTSGLAPVVHKGKKAFLRLDPTALECWHSLNPIERYFTLLEVWLRPGGGETLGEREGRFDHPLSRWRDLTRCVPRQGLDITGNPKEQPLLAFLPGLRNLALMELFGLVTLRTIEPEPGGGWNVAEIQRTQWGDALLELIMKDDNYMSLLFDEEADFSRLQAVIQPFFPQWRNTLSFPAEVFQEGVYVCKVSLGPRYWVRIALPAKALLEELHYAIQQAVDFDDDHLYYFGYRNRFGREVKIYHPYTDEGPYSNEVSIGKLGLSPGTELKYLFDFGDCWHFKIVVESIDDADPKHSRPKILEHHGKAPRQYRDYPYE
jgi:hypothetical protein